MKKILALLLSLTLVFSMAGCGSSGTEGGTDAPEEIVFGVCVALTGPSAAMGEAAVQAITLAVDELNEAGGIMGVPVRVVTRDDEADPTKHMTYVKELVEKEEIDFLFDSPNSTCVAATSDYLTENSIVSLITTATADTLIDAEKYPYAFRVMIPNGIQAKALVKLAYEAGYERIAIIGDNSALGADGMALMKAECEKYGIDYVAEVSYQAGDADLSAVAQEIASAKADCVVSWALGADASKIVKALERLDYLDELTFLGYTGINVANFRTLAGEGADICASLESRSICVDAAAGETGLSAPVQELYGKLTDAYGAYKPDGSGRNTDWATLVRAYDAVYLLKHAIEEAGTIDSAAVKEAIETKSGTYESYFSSAGYNFSAEQHDGFPTDGLCSIVIGEKFESDVIFGDVPIVKALG